MLSLCTETIQGYVFDNIPSYQEGKLYSFHFRFGKPYVYWGPSYSDEIRPDWLSKFISPIIKHKGGLLIWKKEEPSKN